MRLTEVYVALGGNVGQTALILNQALKSIALHSSIRNVQASRFYVTTPVTEQPQRYYVNAVCRFATSLSAEELLHYLQGLEAGLGRIATPRNSPRTIDLDILLFGLEIHQTSMLEIPHPRWKDRLFVLVPLSDIAEEISIPDLHNPGATLRVHIAEMLRDFPNIYNETVLLLNEEAILPIGEKHDSGPC